MSNKDYGNDNAMGNSNTLGDRNTLGDSNTLGDYNRLGNYNTLGDYNRLGSNFQFGKRLTMAGCKVLALMTMANVDGSGRQITVIVHTEGIKIEAGCFSGTLDAFCAKATGEGKTRYVRVVRAAAEALLADVVERGVTGGWEEEQS